MVIIEEVIRNVMIPTNSEPDAIVMGWQERRSTRQRVQTRKGRGLALALPTGTVLMDGDLLYIGQGFHVTVEAEAEDVLVAPLQDATSAAILAYELGNRHLPVAIDHDLLATPYDRVAEDLLARLGTTCMRRRERFEPAKSVGSAHLHQHE
jgi:urease accessory protein